MSSIQGGLPPLFIVGCGRSGTTLLRLMLNAHSQLAIPEESHFIYQELRRRIQAPQKTPSEPGLASRLCGHPAVKRWELPAPLLAEVRGNEAEADEPARVFRRVFECYARSRDKPRWGDKTPLHVQYLLVVGDLFPDARFLHVVRDGRAVALSLMGRRWGPRTIALAGYYWSWLVLSGRAAGAALRPGRYLEVRYEDLVADSERTLRRVCAFAGLKFQSEMLAYHSTPAAREYARGGRVARRLARPPQPQRIDRWRRELSSASRRCLLHQCGAVLSWLNYPVADLPDRQRRHLRRLREGGTPALPGLPAPRPARLGRELRRLRIKQGADLILGRYDSFARRSLLWQEWASTVFEPGG